MYHRYDPAISLLTGISLIIFLVAIAVSVTALVVHAVRFWRAFRSFGRAASAALGDLAQAAGATEARATAVTQGTERLTVATERLQRSLERLAVLRAATADVRRGIGGIRGSVPRK